MILVGFYGRNRVTALFSRTLGADRYVYPKSWKTFEDDIGDTWTRGSYDAFESLSGYYHTGLIYREFDGIEPGTFAFPGYFFKVSEVQSTRFSFDLNSLRETLSIDEGYADDVIQGVDNYFRTVLVSGVEAVDFSFYSPEIERISPRSSRISRFDTGIVEFTPFKFSRSVLGDGRPKFSKTVDYEDMVKKIGQPVYVSRIVDKDELESDDRIYTGVVESDSFDEEVSTVVIKDVRIDFGVSLCPNTLSREDYPNLGDEDVDLPKPVAYGKIRRGDAVLLNWEFWEEELERARQDKILITVRLEYMLHDIAFGPMNTEYAQGENVFFYDQNDAPLPDQAILASDLGICTLDVILDYREAGTRDWSQNDLDPRSVTWSGLGRRLDPRGPGLDLIRIVLTEQCGLGGFVSNNITLAIEAETHPEQIGVSLQRRDSVLSKTFEPLARTLFGVFVVDRFGVVDFKFRDTTADHKAVINIEDRISHSVKMDRSNFSGSMEVQYGLHSRNNRKSLRYVEDAQLKDLTDQFGNLRQPQVYRTYLTEESDVVSLLGVLNPYYTEIDMIMTLTVDNTFGYLELTDVIVVNAGEFGNDAFKYFEIVGIREDYRVRQLTFDLLWISNRAEYVPNEGELRPLIA